MHLLEGYIQRHFIKLVKGKKIKQVPEKIKKNGNETYNDGLTHDEYMETQTRWAQTETQWKKADELYDRLQVPGGLAPKDKVPFQRTGKTKQYNLLIIFPYVLLMSRMCYICVT
jgi:hypothetical protein